MTEPVKLKVCENIVLKKYENGKLFEAVVVTDGKITKRITNEEELKCL